MFLMPCGVKEISKLEKDPEVVQEKKKIKSQLCYVSRAVFVHSASYENELLGLVH